MTRARARRRRPGRPAARARRRVLRRGAERRPALVRARRAPARRWRARPRSSSPRRGAGGRPVIRLDRPVARGTPLEVPRDALPATGEDEYYTFELVGLEVIEEGGRALGRVVDVHPGPANDALDLGNGLLLPLVDACVRSRRPRGGAYPGRARILRSRLIPLRLDVFTLVPHAFAWLTEQRPVAAVLGGELDLRLYSYRDTTPLRLGQRRRRALRRRRRHGAAGRRRRGRARRGLRRRARPPRDRAHPAGPPADPGGRRGARRRGAPDAALRPLRGLRRADRRASLHGRDLDRAVRPLERRPAGDGGRRRDRPPAPGRARRRLGRAGELLARSSEAGSSTRTTRARRSSAAGACPTSCCRATTAESSAGGRSMCVEKPHRPPDRRAAARRARHDRLARHDPRRDPDRARVKQWVINPYRIPSSSMEPTLHCARPGLGCLAAGGLFTGSDRVLACRICYDSGARSAATSSSSTRRRGPCSPAGRAASTSSG